MTKKNCEDIGNALDRCMTAAVQNVMLSHESKIAVFGALAGFKMWFNEYCDKNTEL